MLLLKKKINPGTAITETDFLQSPPQNIPTSLSTLSATIRTTIHDVVTELEETADFSTLKNRQLQKRERTGKE